MTGIASFDKRKACDDALKLLNVQGLTFAQAMAVAWTDGWNKAIDLCIEIEDAISADDMRDVEETADRG